MILLGAAVVAVPIFKRLGLGSVLGYLAAGLAIGPFGLGLFSDPMAILHVAELGVVLFLFIIGLEMQPSRLWALRARDLRAGAGAGAGLHGAARLGRRGAGLSAGGVVRRGRGLRADLDGDRDADAGGARRHRVAEGPAHRRRSCCSRTSPSCRCWRWWRSSRRAGPRSTLADRLTGVAIGLGAIGALVLAGRYLLNPLFGLLAAAKAREVMTAAALLVVLGSALAMQFGGLSTAMGAFLAGVLLSESSFRHQLEADVEPFRGILLGLFFLAVGMALDLGVIAANAGLVAISVTAFIVLKSIGIYAVARLLEDRPSRGAGAHGADGAGRRVRLRALRRGDRRRADRRTGERGADRDHHRLDGADAAGGHRCTTRWSRPPAPSMDGVDRADGLTGRVLLIGFGRVGQIVSQPILARGHSVSIIDTDVEMIRVAADFGWKVYYGDGSRLDVLRAAGASTASAIVVCVDDADTSMRIVELLKSECPLTPILARAWDRAHAIRLVRAGVDEQVRETFESALVLGAKTLEILGEDADAITETVAEVRRSDAERFELQLGGDIRSGRDLVRLNIPRQGDAIALPDPERDIA